MILGFNQSAPMTLDNLEFTEAKKAKNTNRIHHSLLYLLLLQSPILCHHHALLFVTISDYGVRHELLFLYRSNKPNTTHT
ncbi:CLUMA_CG005260, isoform A [Clunio marinus]|uniref:CLUMA_CG005260, isoform A n=1 Tax=Clunio marinus TaxID=568069 RepID=A0A1J1HYJ2_9DIPT|nr:CLUMA_CG005260, isoform A [Clunio marinus]